MYLDDNCKVWADLLNFGPAHEALWGPATSTVQYQKGQYIDTTIDFEILVT